MNKPQTPIKTVLTILIGFLILYLLTRNEAMLYIALIVGLAGVLSPYLRQKIDFLWMKLAYLLSLIVPNILLTIIFYCILFPIALLSRVFGKKDPLQLKNTSDSTFIKLEKTFDKAHFEKPW